MRQMHERLFVCLKFMSPGSELMTMINQNNHSVTFDMIFSMYQKHKKWPRIDRVQLKTFVRGLSRGFVSLTLDERLVASTLQQAFIDTTITTMAYLIHFDSSKGIVDIWGPDQKTVSKAMLAVLRIIRK